MIFLVIFGALMLILGGFYLANSWQQYREWRGGTVIVVLSLIAVVYGTINLPYFHHNQRASEQASSSSRVVQQSGQNSSSFSNKLGSINAQNNSQGSQGDREMAVLRQLQKGYAKFGTVSFDEGSKTYKIKATDGDTVKALQALVQDPSQAQQMGWPNLTKSIKQNSREVDNVLTDEYSLSIVNPDNTKQALYTAKNGKTTYDIANQGN